MLPIGYISVGGVKGKKKFWHDMNRMVKNSEKHMDAAHVLFAQSGSTFVCFKKEDDRYLVKIVKEVK